jgi:hypothetical protein
MVAGIGDTAFGQSKSNTSETTMKKSLLAAVAALTFALATAPAAQAHGIHFHEKLVCNWVQHNGHWHQHCKVVLVPHVQIFGGHHHGHHHHHRHHHH